MTKTREKTGRELFAEIEEGKKKDRQLENREKILRQKLSREECRTHSHRLIVRGAVRHGDGWKGEYRPIYGCLPPGSPARRTYVQTCKQVLWSFRIHN